MDRFNAIPKASIDVADYLEAIYNVGKDFAIELCNRYKEEIDKAIAFGMNFYAIGDAVADKESLSSKQDTDDYFESVDEVAKYDTH